MKPQDDREPDLEPGLEPDLEPLESVKIEKNRNIEIFFSIISLEIILLRLALPYLRFGYLQ